MKMYQVQQGDTLIFLIKRQRPFSEGCPQVLARASKFNTPLRASLSNVPGPELGARPKENRPDVEEIRVLYATQRKA